MVSFLSFDRRNYRIVEVAIRNVGLEPAYFWTAYPHHAKWGHGMYQNEAHGEPWQPVDSKYGREFRRRLRQPEGPRSPLSSTLVMLKAEGPRVRKESTYDMQLIGVDRTKNETVIGGMRRQMRKESHDLILTLVVEYPTLVSNCKSDFIFLRLTRTTVSLRQPCQSTIITLIFFSFYLFTDEKNFFSALAASCGP